MYFTAAKGGGVHEEGGVAGRGGRGELRAQRWQVTPRGSRDVPLTKLSAVSLHEISANELPDKVSKLSMIVNSWCAREEEGSGGGEGVER